MEAICFHQNPLGHKVLGSVWAACTDTRRTAALDRNALQSLPARTFDMYFRAQSLDLRTIFESFLLA
jgi:hypothetical protein